MQKHRIFKKGYRVYGLISSYSNPNMLFPVMGIIRDVKWDAVNPKYLLQIYRFYDDLFFLKKHLIEMNFFNEFREGRRPFVFSFPENLKRREDLEHFINGENAKKFFVVVDSLMCVKTVVDLKELFSIMQSYFITKKIKEIRDLSVRSFYQDTLKLDSIQEFNSRFKKMYGDKFDQKGLKIDTYLARFDDKS